MATALIARVDFVWEWLPGGDNVPAPSISHGKADMSEHMTLELIVVLVRNAKKSQQRQEGDGKCHYLQLVVGMDISSLNDCLNFAQISFHIFNWPIVRWSSERSEAESFYGLRQANPVPPPNFMFPPILTPLTNGYLDLCVLHINEAPLLQMSWILMVIGNGALMTSRCVEQVSIPMFECFSLTGKRIVVTARLEVHFDMLDMANAWFEMSDLFSVQASSNRFTYIKPTGAH